MLNSVPKSYALFFTLGILLLAVGQYLGLYWAPTDRYMGAVSRILFVHVPAAWIAMLLYFGAFLIATISLFVRESRRNALDYSLAATIEVGILFNALLLVLGSLFARPTWGVWWDWDPRLTTTAVMLLSFSAILILRQMLDDPGRRATLTAVVTILASANVPITYMSVRWWRSLHQVQSSPDTMSPEMVTALRVNALAFLAVAIAFVVLQSAIARTKDATEHTPEESVAHIKNRFASLTPFIFAGLGSLFVLPFALKAQDPSNAQVGMITGGHEYIVASYAITWLTFFLFAMKQRMDIARWGET